MTHKLTFDQMVAITQRKSNPEKVRSARSCHDAEHRLQCNCVAWFRYQYAKYRLVLFAVPNGGLRCVRTASRLKAEGVVSGVADLILLVPNRFYHYLCIELKTPVGRQQPSQKDWQAAVSLCGGKYVVVRSLDQFQAVINDYFACKDE